MAHSHSILDTDALFSIDAITRLITNETPKRKRTIVQKDHNSERFTFTLPRYIEGHDMTQCNRVEAHYINIDDKTKKEATGLYVVDDLQAKADDEEKVVCSWLISRNATGYAGKLAFLLRFMCVTTEGDETIIDYAWHTAPYTDIYVTAGIDASEVFEVEYVEIIDKWKASVMAHFAAEFEAWKEKAVEEVNAITTAHLAAVSNYVTPQMFGAAGDGVTDDTEAFLNAFHNIKTNGTLYLPEATYLLSSDIHLAKDIVIVSNGGTIINRGLSLDGIKAKVRGVVFKDCLYSAITMQENSELVIERCSFENIGTSDNLNVTYQGCGIYASAGRSIIVRGCQFKRCRGHGAIFAYDGGYIEVKDNLFIENDYRAINIYGANTATGSISGNRIEECGKYNETGSGVGCNGIYSTNGHGVVVENNIILNSRENAIEGIFLKISGNYIDGTGVEVETKPTPSTEGIYPYSTADFVVANNVVLNTKGCGIKSYTSVETATTKIIADNMIRNSGDVSIEINSSVACKNAIISHNTVDNIVKIVNGDESNVYIGDASKFSGKADLRQNTKALSLFHYFETIEPFNYTNCSPTIESDEDGKYIKVPYAQYAALRYKLPRTKGKQVLHIKGEVMGKFGVNVFKNGAYFASLYSADCTKYEEISCFLNFISLPNEEYEIRFNPSSGNMCLRWCEVSLYN